MAKRQLSSDPVTEYMQTLRTLLFLGMGWVETAAETLGIHPTDLLAGAYLFENGPMTAGELAKVAGLTTGAMTAAIDRLERAGFAKRGADPHDRRKVIVRPTKLPAKLLAMRESIMKKIRIIFSRYEDANLSRMTESMRDIIAVLEKEIPAMKRTLPKKQT